MNVNTENMHVQFPPGITMNILLENTNNKMGNSLLLSYSARDNNYQNLILVILQSNGLSTPRNILFTKQSTSDLFSGLRKSTNTVTDIAQKIDIIIEGGSLLC